MTVNDEQSLREIVRGLEAAWNSGDSVTWAGFFAEDADFIHILGGHFNGRTAIERGHRAIFDTIYKGSTNKYTVKKARFIGPRHCSCFRIGGVEGVAGGVTSGVACTSDSGYPKNARWLENRSLPEHHDYVRNCFPREQSIGCEHYKRIERCDCRTPSDQRNGVLRSHVGAPGRSFAVFRPRCITRW